MKFLMVAVLSLGLWACGSDEAYTLGQQRWGDVVVEVQSRPAPVQAGMNEFLVMATDSKGVPVHNLWVGVRIEEQDAWRQAIQDGFSGVYRRALAVATPEAQLLRIKLKRGMEETDFQFRLVK